MTTEAAALSDLIGEIYDAALDPGRWQTALAHTCEFVGGSSAVLFWHDAASEKSAALHLYNEDPHYTRLYFEKYVKLNPMFPAAAFLETGVVHSATDLVPQHELEKTRFYKEWLKPQGMTDALAAVLEKGIARAAFLNLRWVESDGALDDGARQRLQLVVPHFQRAVTIGRLFDQSKTKEEALAQTLDHMEAAVFLVGPQGQIVFANAAGQGLLDRANLVRAQRKLLSAVSPEADRMLREIFTAAEKGDASIGVRGVAVPLSSASPDQWFAHVLPLTSGQRRQSGTAYAAVAAVFVRKVSPEDPSSLEAFAKQHHLTAGEVRVIEAMMRVNGVKAIAEMLGVSQETVKSHLRHVYRKTGTTRQNALVKLIAGISPPS